MLRESLVAFALWTCASSAFACPLVEAHRGIIFDRAPIDLPADTLVLDVSFNPLDAALHNGPQERTVTALVHRVVRGNYARSTISVVVGRGSCSYPFMFGTRGIIVVEHRPIRRGGPPVFVARERRAGAH